MNSIQVLMEKPSQGQLNVPLEKLAEYLADGWKEISRAPMAGFDPEAKPIPAESGDAQPQETAKQRKEREKAEAAKLAESGDAQPQET